MRWWPYGGGGDDRSRPAVVLPFVYHLLMCLLLVTAVMFVTIMLIGLHFRFFCCEFVLLFVFVQSVSELLNIGVEWCMILPLSWGCKADNTEYLVIYFRIRT